MEVKRTTRPRRAHLLAASTHAVALIDCLEMARAEPRRAVAFWLLDVAASHRRHYSAERRAATAASS